MEMLISHASRGSSLFPSVKCESSYSWDDNARRTRKQCILDGHLNKYF